MGFWRPEAEENEEMCKEEPSVLEDTVYEIADYANDGEGAEELLWLDDIFVVIDVIKAVNFFQMKMTMHPDVCYQLR